MSFICSLIHPSAIFVTLTMPRGIRRVNFVFNSLTFSFPILNFSYEFFPGSLASEGFLKARGWVKDNQRHPYQWQPDFYSLTLLSISHILFQKHSKMLLFFCLGCLEMLPEKNVLLAQISCFTGVSTPAKNFHPFFYILSNWFKRYFHLFSDKFSRD